MKTTDPVPGHHLNRLRPALEGRCAGTAACVQRRRSPASPRPRVLQALVAIGRGDLEQGIEALAGVVEAAGAARLAAALERCAAGAR
jgi:hypothetical protein